MFRGTGALTSLGQSTSLAVAPRGITIRVDPALATCFDPADKELYDLWAPSKS
jgi:hypothetical protein